MRRRIHSISYKHKETKIVIRQDGGRGWAVDAHAHNFVFDGGLKNVDGSDAGFKRQRGENIRAA